MSLFFWIWREIVLSILWDHCEINTVQLICWWEDYNKHTNYIVKHYISVCFFEICLRKFDEISRIQAQQGALSNGQILSVSRHNQPPMLYQIHALLRFGGLTLGAWRRRGRVTSRILPWVQWGEWNHVQFVCVCVFTPQAKGKLTQWK